MFAEQDWRCLAAEMAWLSRIMRHSLAKLAITRVSVLLYGRRSISD